MKLRGRKFKTRAVSSCSVELLKDTLYMVFHVISVMCLVLNAEVIFCPFGKWIASCRHPSQKIMKKKGLVWLRYPYV